MSEPAVEVEDCVRCGFPDRAVDHQRALLERFGERVARAALVTGDRRVFEVGVGGETVFEKGEHAYDVRGVADAVSEWVGTTA